MEITPCIEIHNLKKKFKGFLLDVPELKIPEGFATAFIGENGAGKTTLLRILAGVRLDYKGSVECFGGEMDERQVREAIGYGGPGNYFMPYWSVEQIGEIGSLLYDGFHREQYTMLCEQLGIHPAKSSKKDSQFHKLSDGMKMKVVLASVFARDTRLLLLDEPASPLDPMMRDKLCSMIREYLNAQAGHTVLFSTHNIADMENVTDYVVMIEQGKVVEQGFVEELKDKYVVIKADKVHQDALRDVLMTCQENAYGLEGVCLADQLDRLAGIPVVKERPSLSQLSLAVMKQYSNLA